jgi:hypothetical protein
MMRHQVIILQQFIDKIRVVAFKLLYDKHCLHYLQNLIILVDTVERPDLKGLSSFF